MKTSDRFLKLFKNSIRREYSTNELVESLEIEGSSLVCLVLSFPFLLPIPLPGLSVIFGTVIMFFSVGIILNKKINISHDFFNRKIPQKTLSKIFYSIYKLTKNLDPILKQRFEFIFTQTKLLSIITGLIIATSAFVLLLPLPPGTNFPPALVIVFISLGLLQKDGLFIIIGTILFLIKLILITFFSSLLFNFIN